MKTLHNSHSVSPLPQGGENLLTIGEVARELRCSKAHVLNLTAGRVRGVLPLPSLTLGRRRLIRASTLYEWLRSNERIA